MRELHDRITRLGFAGAALSVAVISVSFWYEVIARYFLAAPTVWAYAVASYALCPMIFLAMPEMSRRGSHIAVVYMVDSLPAQYSRALLRIVLVVVGLVCLFGAWIAGAETWRQYTDGIETISAFPVPKWWISMFVPYGLLSSAIYFLRQVVERPPATQRPDEALS